MNNILFIWTHFIYKNKVNFKENDEKIHQMLLNRNLGWMY